MIDKEKIEKIIKDLLIALGENPNRDGLKDTPKRVAGMFEEFFYKEENIEEKVIKTFKENCKSLKTIEINDIPFCSLCEHHILPFKGVAHIKYTVDDENLIGISKFARIVKHFSKGLQVQERITNNIADFIFSNFNIKGVEVTTEAEHLCMTIRGIKAIGSKTKIVAAKGNM